MSKLESLADRPANPVNSASFKCICGQQEGWIVEHKTTIPCPNCGRQYKGIYNEKKYTIEATEIFLKKPKQGVSE